MIGLLDVLPSLYPGGATWVRRRLDDALDGSADCRVARLGERVCGVYILTPKPSGALKFSTIYVADWARGRRIGPRLIDDALASPRALLSTETYITVAQQNAESLTPLLLRRGFTETALERNRYGVGRHEIVLTQVVK